MSAPMWKEILKPTLFLTGFALVGALALSTVYDFTHERIAENERQALLGRLNALIEPGLYDNDLLRDKVIWPAKDFASATDVTIYRARRNSQPVAALFITTSPNGYSGNIGMVVAVKADGSLAGVRVISHKETPGLGDRIELEKSNWILGFNGKSLGDPPLNAWAVRKDGGYFDQFTGATITPRAVVGAVKAVLVWSKAHFTELFSLPSTETSEVTPHE